MTSTHRSARPPHRLKYAKLAKCSSDTALLDIRALLDRHILVQNPARGRSTSYRLGDTENVTE